MLSLSHKLLKLKNSGSSPQGAAEKNATSQTKPILTPEGAAMRGSSNLPGTWQGPCHRCSFSKGIQCPPPCKFYQNDSICINLIQPDSTYLWPRVHIEKKTTWNGARRTSSWYKASCKQYGHGQDDGIPLQPPVKICQDLSRSSWHNGLNALTSHARPSIPSSMYHVHLCIFMYIYAALEPRAMRKSLVLCSCYTLYDAVCDAVEAYPVGDAAFSLIISHHFSSKWCLGKAQTHQGRQRRYLGRAAQRSRFKAKTMWLWQLLIHPIWTWHGVTA